NFNGKTLEPPKGKHWIWDQDRINEGFEKNLIIFTKNGTPRVKRYLDQKEGDPLSDLWNDDDVKIISSNDKQREEFDGQKPEGLLKRIIELSTNEGDIILDFFMGTGTTQVVAHKMNRQYIGVEQMEYIEDITIKRLKRVIAGEDVGISKDVDWNGGGSFVYSELLSLNDEYVKDIQASKNEEDVEKVLSTMKESAYLNFKVDLEKVSSRKEGYKRLSLEEKKKVLIKVLDMNQLYLSYSEMEDEQYEISEDVKAFNHSFYQKEGVKDE
ncbi:MAG: site-specific DNA-methyltransferase, partial [Alkalibacterium sp.]|nr:site-specific DNA-methyltransferase [Alkalibacterium sp.]